jgi:NAD(P)-dependent dehydrogenase (short-subunit alcohol dehydrogenase family)
MIRFTMGVNLKGVWLCMRAEIPAMLRSGGGSIAGLKATRRRPEGPGGE